MFLFLCLPCFNLCSAVLFDLCLFLFCLCVIVFTMCLLCVLPFVCSCLPFVFNSPFVFCIVFACCLPCIAFVCPLVIDFVWPCGCSFLYALVSVFFRWFGGSYGALVCMCGCPVCLPRVFASRFAHHLGENDYQYQV